MYVIKQLHDTHFLEIERIYKETFPRTDDADFYSAWRTKECNSSLGLYYKAKLVGFAITTHTADTSIRLWFIAVDPAQRSTGAGTQLLTAVMEAVANAGRRLELTPDNCERVIQWYKRHGFVVTKTMPFIHRDIPTCWMEWTAAATPISETERINSDASTETLESAHERVSFSSTDSFADLIEA